PGSPGRGSLRRDGWRAARPPRREWRRGARGVGRPYRQRSRTGRDGQNGHMPAPLDAPPTTVRPCPQRRAVLAALPGVVVLPGLLSACGMTEPPDPASTAQSTTSVPEASLP